MSMYSNNNVGGNQNQMPQMQMGGNFSQGNFPTNQNPQMGMSGGLSPFTGPRRGTGGMSGMPSMGGAMGGAMSGAMGGAMSGAMCGTMSGAMGGVGGGGGNGSGAGRIDRRSNSGMGNMSIDASSMSDIFGRRSSINFDDSFFGRRDSLDTSTAVIDACILDLTRRRISMAMGVPATQGGVSNDLGIPTPVGPGGVNPMAASGGSHQSFGPQNAATSIAARQQQIQQQQMELDKRQKEIDMQRQQLLAGLQDPSMHGGMGGQVAQGGMGGLGSFNHNSSSSNRMPASMPAAAASNTAGGERQQQWWICQVCNGRAFASRQEATEHEEICAADNRGGPLQLQHHQQQQQHHQQQQLHQQQHAQHQQQHHMQHHKMDRQLPAPTPMCQHNFAGMSHMGGQQDSLTDGVGDGGDEGPFSTLPLPLPLAMASDKDWLTPLHCFVRAQCVEVFCATTQDVATPSKGKRKPIQIGQIGIRCPHCHTDSAGAGHRERGSVYYPTTISSIYNATMNLLQRHLHSCSAVPEDIMHRYQTLKSDDARSGTSKKYWVESALSLGLVDTANGIRFSARRPPPLPRLSRQQHSTGMHSADRRNSNDFFSTSSNAEVGNKEIDLPMDNGFHDMDGDGLQEGVEGGGKSDLSQNEIADKSTASTAPLVSLDDKPYATAFSYHLLSQMQPCVFTEADRLGKRKGLPAGFAGLACRHCFGGYGSGRFFPSSIKTLSDTSKTLNVLYNHMQRCRKCPVDVKDTLEKLRVHHDDDRAKMKFGSQKAFFAKIWSRLHERESGSSGGRYSDSMKRKLPPGAFLSPSDRMMEMSHVGHMGSGSQTPHHQMANVMMGGLDVLSRQAEADMSKRQRIGL